MYSENKDIEALKGKAKKGAQRPSPTWGSNLIHVSSPPISKSANHNLKKTVLQTVQA